MTRFCAVCAVCAVRIISLVQLFYTMPPKNPRIRTAISINIKKEICEYMQVNTNINQGEVTLFFNTKYQELNISRSAVNKIWKNREKWLATLSNLQTSHTFRQRLVLFPEVDKALQIWTSQAVAAGLPLTDMILQQKGLEFSRMLNIEDQLKCANGWVYRFKQRNGLQKVNFSGEANSAPLESLPEERTRLRAILSKYNENDIYNADETGLFFRMEQNQTLSTGAVAGHKKVIFYFRFYNKIFLFYLFLFFNTCRIKIEFQFFFVLMLQVLINFV